MTDEYALVGGGNIYRLGTREYVHSFFLAIEKYVFKEKLYRQLDWTLITDGLYRRTTADEQLDSLIGMMNRMLLAMEETKLSSVDWAKLGLDGPPDGYEKLCGSLGSVDIHFSQRMAEASATNAI